MSSGGGDRSEVLDSHASGSEERSGLGLVSALLQLPDLSDGGRREGGREGLVMQRERRWFEPMSPSVARPGLSSHGLIRKGSTSQRIQQSLSRLDQVLASPRPSSTLLTSLETTPTASYTLPADEDTPAGTARLDLSRSAATPQGHVSMMNSTGVLRELVLASTPTHDRTEMPAGSETFLLHGCQLLEDPVLGEGDSTMLEDPARKVGGDLIMAFCRELSAHASTSQCLDMAAALEKCCEVQWNILTDFEKQTRLSVSQLLSELRMEMATWQLLHVLARDRVGEGGAETGPEVRLGSEGASDKELADDLFIRDSSVRQAQLVVDWLEGVARAGLEHYPVKAAYFADSVCWENTLHDLSRGIDTDLLVTEMDPDAPTRQQRRLSELDSRDELSLNKHLFACLRAGQLDKALGICVSSGQPGRAVMLEGWRLHHDPNMDAQGSEELQQVEGNEFRDVWKASCWQMLHEPMYDVYEKAMFAALSGNVHKILPACQSWYDHVWAYFKTLVDVQVEKALRSRARHTGRDLVELPPEYWSNVLLPEQIFQEIEASPSTDVHMQCQIHFHVVQKYIILDDLTGLVDEMYGWLAGPPASQPSIHRLRFMAHMCLVVRSLGRVREDNKVNGILGAYVEALTEARYLSAVALYAAQLPTEAQVNSYARLLAGVQRQEEQRHCLELGKEAGLDIAMVTKAVVETIRDTGVEAGVRAGSVELGQEVELTQLDQTKVEAINWLVYEEDQRAEAVRQGNALTRQFLAARKFSAAKAVFQKIPPDSAELIRRLWQRKAGVAPLPREVVSDLRELQAIQTYLEAKEAFNVWFQHVHHKMPATPPEPPEGMFREQVAYEHSLTQYKLEYEQWRSQRSFLTEEVSGRLYDVLVFAGGWMRPEVTDGDRGEVYGQQLQALRQICLPEVSFLLHSVLHSSGHYKKCLQIADIITSNKYMLYKEFRANELTQLLSLLQRSALSLTSDPTSDELGYPVV